MATNEKPSAWFAVARSVFEHEMFTGEPYSRREAWLWLIAKAAWKDHEIITRAGVVTLKRGDVVIGRDHLAKAWGWSPKAVRTFVHLLVAAKMLEVGQRNGQYASVAKISNFERFQNVGTSDGPSNGPTRGQRGANEGPHSTKKTIVLVSAEDCDDVDIRPAHLSPKSKTGHGLTVADRFEAEAAIVDYNTAATELGFARSTVTDQRLASVAKRLRDLGRGDLSVGREHFREALQAIGHWPFLAGREKPRAGHDRFRLSIERLLSTGSRMGDVLARLLDLYAEHGAATAKPDAPIERGAAFADVWALEQAEHIQAQAERLRWVPEPTHGGPDAVL